MQLTSEQQATFDGVLANLRSGCLVQTVGGYAGTGKTVLAAALADALPRFAVSAFTGKAAHVLRGKGVDRAQTYHSLIYHPEEVSYVVPIPQSDGTVKYVTKRRVEWHLKQELDGVSGILVDEASMVSGKHYHDLASFGLPLIFVGDHGQLEPVGDDPGLMADPDWRLETIHRNANEIAHFGAHLRGGNWASAWRHVSGAGECVKFVSPTELIARMRETEQTVVAFNVSRVSINRQYRAEVLRQTGNLPVAGDRLIVLRNTKSYGVFNGQQVTVEQVMPPRMVRVRTEDERVIDVDFTSSAFNNPKPEIDTRPDSPVPLDFAYAVTVHKAQGSEWDSGLVVEQFCPKWDHARWAYTAATRFKNRLYWTNSKWK